MVGLRSVGTLVVLLGLWITPPVMVVAESIHAPLLSQTSVLEEANQLEQQFYQLYQQGKYKDAIPLAEKVLAIREQNLKADDLLIAKSLNNLALLYRVQGRYGEAEPLYQRALKIREKALGSENPDVATSLNNLAELYQAQGRYGQAEPLYQRALKISEKALGSEHPDVATSLNNLALLYRVQGRYGEAEPLYQRALKISEKALGSEHPDVATSLNNLASLYYFQGRYGEAEPLYQRALKIREKALGSEHPDVAGSLNNLALLYRVQGRYGEAEPLYQRALKISEKALGSEHPDVAISLNNLAELYRAQGRYGQAEPLYQRALKIREKALGSEHPTVATSLNNLVELYWANNNIAAALASFTRGLDIEELNISRNLTFGAEQQKRDYLAQFQGSTDAAISFHLQQTLNNSQTARLALTTILRRKGRILDVLGQSFQRLRQTVDPNIAHQIDQLQDLYNQRSHLFSRDPSQLNPQAYQEQLQTLQTQTQQLEGSLSRSSAELQQQFTPVQIEQIQQVIPSNAALVEFILYHPFTPKAKPQERFGSPHYAAYILTPTGEIRWADLGSASDLDPLIKAFRQSVLDSSVRVSKIQQQPAQALYQKLFQPVRSLVGNAQHLLIAPDGSLNLIPFEALVDAQNQYLIQTYQITYLSSGRDLLRLNLPSPQQQPPLLMANPDYGPILQNSNSSSDSDRTKGQKRSLDQNQTVGPLTGTVLEGSALAKLIPQSRLLTQAQATETDLKQSPNPSLLHLATHGFFLADQPLPQATDTAALRTYENPLLRSGLALAGFNRRQDANQDDGVLTALEISGLDFRATQQVTLSACETGLGDVVNGEGVYGLRRAFTLAGAHSQLMSLWKIDDPATRTMMVAYYQRLQQGMPRGEALREVQLQMLRGQLKNDQGQTYEHPYFWAAFVRTGDWSPLRPKGSEAVKSGKAE